MNSEHNEKEKSGSVGHKAFRKASVVRIIAIIRNIKRSEDKMANLDRVSEKILMLVRHKEKRKKRERWKETRIGRE